MLRRRWGVPEGLTTSQIDPDREIAISELKVGIFSGWLVPMFQSRGLLKELLISNVQHEITIMLAMNVVGC